ncbi:MAG: PAS domain-containing protein [Pseudomonadota bacterium]|nr:PAS domain-containing protein [Pseudomonadota bacterium]
MTLLPSSLTPPSFLADGGEMGARIRAFDWAATELGAPHDWPSPLRTTLRLMLTTGHPVFIFWGPEHRCFYNDAYSRSLGPEKHPCILGQPAREAWAEIWATVGPQIEHVLQGRGATWHENQLIPILRHGVTQEVYWTYSYAPIDKDDGSDGVGGVLVLVTETTSEVLNRQRLEAAESRWRSLFQQAPGFVCILEGPEFRFEFVNPRYEALLGGRPLLGLTVDEAVPEATGQGFVALLDAVYRGGLAQTGAAVPLSLLDPADGVARTAFVDFVYEPIRDESGQVSGIFVQGSDVTDEVRARRSLVESEARYRALAENLPGGAVFIVDHELRYVTAVGEALTVAGLSGADFVGRTVADVQGPVNAPVYEERYRRALAGESFENEHQEHGRFYLTRGIPLRDDSGQVTGALAASYDITARRETERQLERAAAKLEGVLASAEVGLWSWNLGTDRIEQDANVARLYGLPDTGTATAAEHLDRIHPDDRADMQQAIEAALSGGLLNIREYRVLRGGGDFRWLAGRGRLTRDAAGQPEWLTGLVIDISDLKAMEQSLRANARQKDEFLAMLAHELRNPLAPIRNAGEILHRIASPDARVRNVTAILRRQVDLLSRLVDDLLDVSRITHQRIELANRLVRISEVVAQAVETVAPLLESKAHHISVSNTGMLNVMGDPTRLVQCVVNVLTNAAKYTDPGGKIQVSTYADGGEVVVKVTDNGLGIGADLLPYVFDLFVQNSRTLDRSQGGLGIGLSLVKRLIEMQGGHVHAASAGLGSGSSFEIRLPLAHSTDNAHQGSPGPSLRPLRILVVDDNVDAAESLSVMLCLDGHVVETVNSSTDALTRIETESPEVVLIDIGMPGMDGYEVARRVRTRGLAPSVRLIALTGYGQAEDRDRALEAGFEDHLVKPVAHSRLTESLGR